MKQLEIAVSRPSPYIEHLKQQNDFLMRTILEWEAYGKQLQDEIDYLRSNEQRCSDVEQPIYPAFVKKSGAIIMSSPAVLLERKENWPLVIALQSVINKMSIEGQNYLVISREDTSDLLALIRGANKT